MSVRIFISGSISIKRLPNYGFRFIDQIISNNFEILVDNACDTINNFTDKN